jgi:hypothetical protein
MGEYIILQTSFHLILAKSWHFWALKGDQANAALISTNRW